MKLIIQFSLRVLLTTSFTFKFFPLFSQFFSMILPNIYIIPNFYFSLLRKGSIEKQEEQKHQTVQN